MRYLSLGGLWNNGVGVQCERVLFSGGDRNSLFCKPRQTQFLSECDHSSLGQRFLASVDPRYGDEDGNTWKLFPGLLEDFQSSFFITYNTRLPNLFEYADGDDDDTTY